MLTASFTDFRKDLKFYIDQITSGIETLIINRGKGKGVVIMSIDEYNALMATSHELTSRKNAARLDSAIEKLNGGQATERPLTEP